MLMKYLIHSCIVAVLIFVSCKDKAPQEPPANTENREDSGAMENIDTLLSAETIQSFSTSGFSGYAKEKSPGFDWSKFRMTATWQEDSALVTPFHPDKAFYASYGPFLKYSPDSSMFIDLDSYNIEIRKDSKGRYIGSELGPDCEVSLVDIEGGKKTRLVFLGPGGSIEDGIWLDNQTLVLMGVQDNGEGGKTASLWRYHVPTHTFYLYEIPDTAVAAPLIGYWRKERLKHVIIQ
jgi:hypothetical protein